MKEDEEKLQFTTMNERNQKCPVVEYGIDTISSSPTEKLGTRAKLEAERKRMFILGSGTDKDAAAIKIQATIRSALTRNRVREMVEKMIEELMAEKKQQEEEVAARGLAATSEKAAHAKLGEEENSTRNDAEEQGIMKERQQRQAFFHSKNVNSITNPSSSSRTSTQKFDEEYSNLDNHTSVIQETKAEYGIKNMTESNDEHMTPSIIVNKKDDDDDEDDISQKKIEQKTKNEARSYGGDVRSNTESPPYKIKLRKVATRKNAVNNPSTTANDNNTTSSIYNIKLRKVTPPSRERTTQFSTVPTYSESNDLEEKSSSVLPAHNIALRRVAAPSKTALTRSKSPQVITPEANYKIVLKKTKSAATNIKGSLENSRELKEISRKSQTDGNKTEEKDTIGSHEKEEQEQEPAYLVALKKAKAESKNQRKKARRKLGGKMPAWADSIVSHQETLQITDEVQNRSSYRDHNIDISFLKDKTKSAIESPCNSSRRKVCIQVHAANEESCSVAESNEDNKEGTQNQIEPQSNTCACNKNDQLIEETSTRASRATAPSGGEGDSSATITSIAEEKEDISTIQKNGITPEVVTLNSQEQQSATANEIFEKPSLDLTQELSDRDIRTVESGTTTTIFNLSIDYAEIETTKELDIGLDTSKYSVKDSIPSDDDEESAEEKHSLGSTSSISSSSLTTGVDEHDGCDSEAPRSTDPSSFLAKLERMNADRIAKQMSKQSKDSGGSSQYDHERCLTSNVDTPNAFLSIDSEVGVFEMDDDFYYSNDFCFESFDMPSMWIGSRYAQIDYADKGEQPPYEPEDSLYEVSTVKKEEVPACGPTDKDSLHEVPIGGGEFLEPGDWLSEVTAVGVQDKSGNNKVVQNPEIDETVSGVPTAKLVPAETKETQRARRKRDKEQFKGLKKFLLGKKHVKET